MQETNGTTATAEAVSTPATEPKAEIKKKSAPKAVKPRAEPKFVRFDTAKEDLKRLKLAKDEEDPYFDARQNLEVSEGLTQSMADEDEPAVIKVVEDGSDYKVWDGRNRVRAAPEANRLRRKAGKPPIVFHLAVVDPPANGEPSEIIKGTMRANIRQDSPPCVLAQDISRALAADVTEEWLCATLGMTSAKLHQYIALLDLPKAVQKHVDENTISIAAALALTKLDLKDVELAAEKLVAAAKVGKRVSAAQVANPNHDSKVATKKEIRQYVLDLQSDPLPGKNGKALTQAFVMGVEICLGFRSTKQATAALIRIAKGEDIKINYSPYQTE
jgi:hypothetical protein